MNMKFEKVVMHNFLSIGDAEVNFNDRGYVMVQGRNNCVDDNSASNGSGKSSIFESIIYCLTGKTIRGTKDVVNINGEDGCYVGAEFYVDDKHYKVFRSKNHKKYKTDLKIYIDGVDKSGKGIADGEKLLAEYLPDITYELLGSVIVLGQGLPQRFTNNTPAKRKEILENLSKSDFMIEDLKDRVEKRTTALKGQIRTVEDTLVSLSSQKMVYDSQIARDSEALGKIDEDKTDAQISEMTVEVETRKKALDASTEIVNTLTERANAKREEATVLAEALNTKLSETRKAFPSDESISSKYPVYTDIEKQFPSTADIRAKYPTSANIETRFAPKETEALNAVNKINTDIGVLEKDINTKDKVVDICPTCGQKLPNVQKIDTTHLKEELAELRRKVPELVAAYDSVVAEKKAAIKENDAKITEELDTVRSQVQKAFSDSEAKKNDELKANRESIANAEATINAEFASQKEKIKSEYTAISTELNSAREKLTSDTVSYNTSNQKLLELVAYKNQIVSQKKTLADNIASAKKSIAEIEEKILYNNNEKDRLSAHLEMNTKFATELKRDFRSHLLTNVINFISDKAKEYSQEVFETDKIIFAQDGNNIDIGYNGKDYSSLSGGEKQKVDLIVQFAIRDMLCTYMDFSSNLLVVDEIFDNLDSIGCENVVNLIATKLSDIKSIFIVTHHTDIEIPYDAEITVVKSKEGISSIE